MSATQPAAGEPCRGMAAHAADKPLAPWEFTRRAVGPGDVKIAVVACGVCHSDLHCVRGEWAGFWPCPYPMCPGHEIVGRVTDVGAEVKAFKAGDAAGVGCMVRSCGDAGCGGCAGGEEQFCPKCVYTYASKDVDGSMTQGGYTTHVVVDQRFVLRWPEAVPMQAGAPLLCAGITTYSPLRRFKMDRPGQRIGVVGLGGLGHMAVKFVKAFGGHPVVISRTDSKRAEAVDRLGAAGYLVSSAADAMAAAVGTLDGIVDTVSAEHSLAELVALLKKDCTLVLLGMPPGGGGMTLPTLPLMFRRASIAASPIGGIRETQEMLDFCAEKGIAADVEVIPAAGINDAYGRMLEGNVRYRFVIDIAGSLQAP